MDNNAYLIADNATGDHLLVDAAGDAESLLALLRATGTHGDLVGIVTTHRHADHHGALVPVAQQTGAPVVAGAADADYLPVTVQRRLEHLDQIQVGQLYVHVVALRGHTPGSVALALPGTQSPTLLFSGDSIFPGGLGRTTSPQEFDQLFADVSTRVFDQYQDSTVVLPGHGDNTTLGAERESLSDWRARGW